jgi:hypothetical protein
MFVVLVAALLVVRGLGRGQQREAVGKETVTHPHDLCRILISLCVSWIEYSSKAGGQEKSICQSYLLRVFVRSSL